MVTAIVTLALCITVIVVVVVAAFTYLARSGYLKVGPPSKPRKTTKTTEEASDDTAANAV